MWTEAFCVISVKKNLCVKCTPLLQTCNFAPMELILALFCFSFFSTKLHQVSPLFFADLNIICTVQTHTYTHTDRQTPDSKLVNLILFTQHI